MSSNESEHDRQSEAKIDVKTISATNREQFDKSVKYYLNYKRNAVILGYSADFESSLLKTVYTMTLKFSDFE